MPAVGTTAVHPRIIARGGIAFKRGYQPARQMNLTIIIDAGGVMSIYLYIAIPVMKIGMINIEQRIGPRRPGRCEFAGNRGVLFVRYRE
jgi:hypothetical protein